MTTVGAVDAGSASSPPRRMSVYALADRVVVGDPARAGDGEPALTLTATSGPALLERLAALLGPPTAA